MIVRKASKVFKWEECGDYFQLRALKYVRSGISIDWDIGVKQCPPNQPKRTLNVSDTSGMTLTTILKGSTHYLTPDNVEEPQWTMETSPLIEVLQNPRENHEIDCSAFKNQSKKMKLLFLRMAPNTTITVLGNTALRKFLRQHLTSLAERNIKIYLSVKPSPNLLVPPVPICYATDLVNKTYEFTDPSGLGLKCSGCGKFIGTETSHLRHIRKCNKFKTYNDPLILETVQPEATTKALASCQSQNLGDFNENESVLPLPDSLIALETESASLVVEAPEPVTPSIGSPTLDFMKDPGNQNINGAAAVPMSTSESDPVSLNEALETLASAIGDTIPSFFMQTEAISSSVDFDWKTPTAESDQIDSNAGNGAISIENTPYSVLSDRSPALKEELQEEEDNGEIMRRICEKEQPELRRSSRAQKRKFESFTRLRTDTDWQAAVERDRKANKRLWSPVKVIGPRDIFKAPGLNKVAIFPDMDLKVEKVEPAEDTVESTEPDEFLFE